jgi:drug/metabolite transporter (DMT)-like permease
MPPFLSAGARFALAGLLLATVLTLRGQSLRVTRRELAACAALGAALLDVGVGVVTVAETRIDSSVAAIIASAVPLQVVLLRFLSRQRIARTTLAGVAVGLAGVALVVVLAGGGGSSLGGLAIMLCASISWSLGSFFSHRAPLPRNPFVSTVWEMLAAALFSSGQRPRPRDLGSYLVEIGLRPPPIETGRIELEEPIPPCTPIPERATSRSIPRRRTSCGTLSGSRRPRSSSAARRG